MKVSEATGIIMFLGVITVLNNNELENILSTSHKTTHKTDCAKSEKEK